MSKKEIPIQTIGYGERHKIRVKIPYPIRKGICMACGKSVHRGELKTTQMHHWKYAYKNETVKKNPLLALENTVELCFACHQIADGLRAMLRLSPQRIVNVAMLMPRDMKRKMDAFVERWLELRKYEQKDFNSSS